jgi:hypothetical protein
VHQRFLSATYALAACRVSIVVVAMQVADLCLWPICMGGYDPANRPYTLLRDCGKLIDSRLALDDMPTLGIKYSCWELVTAQKN